MSYTDLIAAKRGGWVTVDEIFVTAVVLLSAGFEFVQAEI